MSVISSLSTMPSQMSVYLVLLIVCATKASQEAFPETLNEQFKKSINNLLSKNSQGMMKRHTGDEPSCHTDALDQCYQDIKDKINSYENEGDEFTTRISVTVEVTCTELFSRNTTCVTMKIQHSWMTSSV